jgi:hypothetical protein
MVTKLADLAIKCSSNHFKQRQLNLLVNNVSRAISLFDLPFN